MLVDSHCHLDRLDLAPFNGQLQAALDAARNNGVTQLLCVSIDLEHFPAVLATAEHHPQVYASVGVHPNEREGVDPDVATLVAFAQHPKIIAIGETGLDYYRSEGDLEWQRQRLRTHIAAAKAVHKPLIIHMREASADTLRILREENASEVGGVMHCFTEDWATAQAAMDLNFYISFSGIVTFKTATVLQQVAKQLPLGKMLVETDSPYLAPVPFRGKSNQPAYVRQVAEYIAQLRGISLQTLATATTQNFMDLFNPTPQ
ncbi:MAG: TatD family hydrolase [Gammaproteobacteria bacterium]|nr:TatD family hydrolase [Gammaproteobacteria bacterium]